MPSFDENTFEGQSNLPYRPYEQYGPYVDAVPSTEHSTFYQNQLPPVQPAPARTIHAEKTPARSTKMPKAEALALVRKWKRGLVAGSLVAFGLLSGLVAANAVSANANQQTPASNPDTNNSNNTTTTPSDNGGFFNNNNNNNNQGQGGYGFGNDNSGQQPAISGSHAS
ncbi:hypothetical protein [Dictyobacter kobayashii]|uniref:Uncharacterized protein n=1 Tax=Dictyobacter kobayashii TaxID=2014872 RepID=A0A402AI59_9CHLR|nr:hypothetical protein [Dictyobacter kobayashii]GCE18745.1 hypothetical protein KDK_25450 [Dictyobacter kobayashii]